MLCGSCIQPKKQFNVQIIGVLEEIHSFYWPKSTYEKATKNLCRAPPLVWTKSKRTAAFFRDPFPYVMAAYGRKSAVRTKPEFDVTFLVTFGTLFRWLRVVLWQKLKQFLKKIWVGKCVHTSVWTTHALGAYLKARTFYSSSNISSDSQPFLKLFFAWFWFLMS